MIIQELHRLQHQLGYLSDDQLRGLAERLSVPLHRLHEVASFYPHFRLQPPPVVDIKVCRDMACHLRGAEACRRKLEELAHEVGGKQISVADVSCLGQCDHAPAVSINDHIYRGKSDPELAALARQAAAGEPLPRRTAERHPQDWKIDPYGGEPRYEVIQKLIERWKSDMDSDHVRKRHRLGDPVLEALETARLRGMGGAGFPTARKWIAMRDAPGSVKYVICNGDESEPGTFKDRELLRRTPYLLVEGLVIAGFVTGAERGYVYIRHEYQDEIDAVREAIHSAERRGFCGSRILGSDASFSLEVVVSPGGYICGEASALLEAMEERRAEPRNKPPFSVHEGLFGKPTVINNVETLCWVPAILTHGGTWYRDQGTHGASGRRFVSISGDVVRPGVYEVPFGQTVRELVVDTAGGVPEGRRLKAIASSGPSGGFLPARVAVTKLPPPFVQRLVERKVVQPDADIFDVLDLPLDPELMKPFPDLMLGAAFIVYDERADMIRQALNCVDFYRRESCGKCVPCRTGTQKLVDMIQRIIDGRANGELNAIPELAQAMLLTSICGLGQVAANPILSAIKYFPDDLAKYVPPATP